MKVQVAVASVTSEANPAAELTRGKVEPATAASIFIILRLGGLMIKNL
jgi:hypothetical protein